ncbi:MAG: hypothetical protein IJH53_00305 [Oscillospiraceae bacterium]|nr:hypothetical protein [Oscillospiraceae bacterium]
MDVKPSTVLTMGILAVVTCGWGILGIIFGAIGKNKARAYVDAYGQTTGQVKAGSIMSKIGFIVGIVMTVIWVIYIIAIVASGVY